MRTEKWFADGSEVNFITDNGIVSTVCECFNHKSINRHDAAENARLIAAAPDLLLACENALVNLKPLYSSDHLVIKSLIAAIAKAKG